MILFDLLHSNYHLCSPTTRCLMLSTYMKSIHLFPEIRTSTKRKPSSSHQKDSKRSYLKLINLLKHLVTLNKRRPHERFTLILCFNILRI